MVCIPIGMYRDQHPFGTWDSFFMNMRKDDLTSTLCVQDSSADLGVIFRSLQERPSCLSQLMPLLHRKQ